MARTFTIYLQDPSTLTAATLQDYADLPEDGELIDYVGSVGTAPTGVVATPIAGASAVFDVNKNGTTIFTTQANRPAILDGATAMSTTPPAVTRFRKGDRISLDCDYIGSTIAGADAAIALRFRSKFNRQ